MRKLYFDIDGTLLDIDSGEPKAALANGVFEETVRHTGMERLICIGSFVDVVRAAEESDESYDGMGVLFRICSGVFSDESWFRNNISLVQDSTNRAGEVDLTEDWWYVDDLADYYFRLANRESVFVTNAGKRILVPFPSGDGNDILNWLEEISNFGLTIAFTYAIISLALGRRGR